MLHNPHTIIRNQRLGSFRGTDKEEATVVADISFRFNCSIRFELGNNTSRLPFSYTILFFCNVSANLYLTSFSRKYKEVIPHLASKP
ncbi:hypothetical protein ADA01nite_17880 [Aneurinibacillus danicus]|jgi:hypothetical protein|uniref:Uncharacterized protein n=1 Tax=Aneurinibacillus danicus TaxID=267746 RepID=A0A511V8U9_9BACL|nr:hypothetical protein ADA01nite_17880 [Aneurinibacillus danicus]